MAEFIEFLSKDALSELNKANEALVKMVANVETVGQKMKGLSTPSSTDSAIKQLTADYQKQEKVIQELQKELEKLATAKTKNAKSTREEIVNNRIVNSQTDTLIKANTALAGAYAQLSAKAQLASKNLRDYIVAGRQAGQTNSQFQSGLKSLQGEFDNYNRKLLQADKAVGAWGRTNQRVISGATNLMGAFGIATGLYLAVDIAQNIFNTTKELIGLESALKTVTGTQANFLEQQAFLKTTAEQYGVEIKSLTKQFTQFYVSAKDKISGDEIQGIFSRVAKASSVMGLSQEQSERAFLALNQMMSKGTIQAEELRGQLGEALPGAFGIMAKAVGVTEKQLGKMMKAGDLLAADVLPKFAKELEKVYGIESVNRVETLTAKTNRLSNAWTEFVRNMNGSKNELSAFFGWFVDSASFAIKWWGDLLEGQESKRQRYLDSLRDANTKLAQNNLSQITGADQKQKYATDRLIELEEQKAKIEKLANDLVSKNRYLKNKPTSWNPLIASIQKEIRRDEFQKNGEQLAKYNNQIVTLQGLIKGYTIEKEKENDITAKTAEQLKKEEAARKKLIKALREEYLSRTEIEKLEIVKIQTGFLQKLQQQKTAMEEVQKATSNTAAEYANYQKVIDGLQQSIDLIIDPSKAIKQTGVAELERITGAMHDTSKSSEELEANLKNLFQTTANGALSGFGMDSLIPMFDGTFNKMWDTANTFNEKMAVGMKYIGDVAKDTFAFINQQQQMQYDAQYARLEQEKNVALLFAGESATAKAEIERQYEERRKQIQRRQAQDQKKMAIFNAVINTAQGVTAALATGPAGIPLAVVIGLLGAVQIAMISSQVTPQFWAGTDNAPEGVAWTQERGREIITDKHGNIKSLGSDSGAQLTRLNKGDKVFTNKDTEAMLFNKELNGILMNNGISSPIIVNQSSGMTDGQVNKIVDAIDSKVGLELNFDANGFSKYKNAQGQRIQLVNNRLNIRTYDI